MTPVVVRNALGTFAGWRWTDCAGLRDCWTVLDPADGAPPEFTPCVAGADFSCPVHVRAQAIEL